MTLNQITFTPGKVISVVTILLAISLSWLPQLDTIAEEHIETGLQRSLVSYATARGLNAVISAVQGTETAIHPVGVGVTLTPGQLLDPLNDLVETFSDLMLAASIAFGIHKILLTIGSEMVISGLVTGIGLLWLAFRLLRDTVPPFLSNFLLILLLVRFAIPVMVVSSDLLFTHFMADTYEGRQVQLDESVSELPVVETENTALEKDIAQDNQKQGFLSTLQSLKMPTVTMPKNPVQSIKQQLSENVRHIIDVMVIFVLHVLVIPVLALWILYRSAQKLIEPSRFRTAVL